MPDHQSRSALGAVGLSGKYVTSKQIFERETTQVFCKSWICLGHESELAESGCITRTIEGISLLVVRSDNRRLRAFRNFCRHRGSRLVSSESCANLGDQIRCPYHAWTYNRNGELTSAPNMKDVEQFSKDDFGLLQVDCETWHGFIWVRLQRQSGSVASHLQPLEQHAISWSLDELKIGKEIRYEVNANWKLIFQNYSECYHCPTVHPALNRLTPYKGSKNDLEQGPILGGPMKLADDCESMSSSGKRVATWLPKLNDEQKRMVAYYTLFPTLFISFHPDYVLLHRLERKSKDETTVFCQFLFHPDSLSQPDFDPEPAVEFWDLTNRQDWEVCELAHAGMSEPGYVAGPYSNLESVVAAFDRNYLHAMNEECSS